MKFTRRNLLQTGAVSTISIPTLGGIRANALGGKTKLVPVEDSVTGVPLIKLPEGFSYSTCSWESTKMADGNLIPKRHDGMAVVPGANSDEFFLLRNHENWFDDTPLGGTATPCYDDAINTVEIDNDGEKAEVTLTPSGGVTGLRFKNNEYQETVPLLSGTMVNCAGGLTPWGTWLTCEEIVLRGNRVEMPTTPFRDHGYVFEVPPPHLGKASAKPIKEMGLFRHEAVLIDPDTSYAYLTEDNGSNSGLFRFIPNDSSQQVGSLENGGKLQMLKVKGTEGADLRQHARGDKFEIEWVDIDEPDSDPENIADSTITALRLGEKSGPYLQGEMKGGAQFSRLEGCWYHDGVIYFVDTDSGPARKGSLWLLDPKANVLTVHYTSPSELHADAIDNVTVNHQSGLIVACEDGGGIGSGETLQVGSRMLAIKPNGIAIAFAENNMNIRDLIPGKGVELADYRGSEWAGATFSPDGKTLFANIQTPGVTFAITGPWNEL